MSRNLILNTEFQNFINPGNFQEYSGILDFAWKWPFFCQFCRVGHQFSLIFVAKHEFCIKKRKMTFFLMFSDVFYFKTQKLQETKVKLNWCPTRQNWQKDSHFQAKSRVPENFWKFPGMMKFWNSVFRIKFLVIN